MIYYLFLARNRYLMLRLENSSTMAVWYLLLFRWLPAWVRGMSLNLLIKAATPSRCCCLHNNNNYKNYSCRQSAQSAAVSKS